MKISTNSLKETVESKEECLNLSLVAALVLFMTDELHSSFLLYSVA